MMSRRSLFLLGLIGLAFVAPAFTQTLDGSELDATTVDETAALASFPYCVCSDYKCKASPYRLRYKGTFKDPKNAALARICYTVNMVSPRPACHAVPASSVLAAGSPQWGRKGPGRVLRRPRRLSRGCQLQRATRNVSLRSRQPGCALACFRHCGGLASCVPAC